MTMKKLSSSMLDAIEVELQKQVARINDKNAAGFSEMLTYHLGWTGDGSGPEARGKRIRPLLLLLVTASCGIAWESALPAAAAVELVHNFSLVHDDIQDNSELRRGRPCVWKKWGMPLGINTGDALFVLSNQAVLDLMPAYPPEVLVKLLNLLQNACLQLTCGQYLDMTYEKRTNLVVEDYWLMIEGKTSALIKACCEIGALLGRADDPSSKAYADFGHYLGLAFQVQDDFLGIWGETTTTGKSITSDIVSGKKTLPILYGLERAGRFAQHWKDGTPHSDNVHLLSNLLVEEGAFLFTQETIDTMNDLAFQMLRMADPLGEAGEELFKILSDLQKRNR